MKAESSKTCLRMATPSGFKPRRRLKQVVRNDDEADVSSSSMQFGEIPMRMTPQEVDEAWKALIEETLPPEKQEALMQTYEDEPDARNRYNMLLEFSSYLRQVRTPTLTRVALPCQMILRFIVSANRVA